jgi:hypothetical protein
MFSIKDSSVLYINSKFVDLGQDIEVSNQIDDQTDVENTSEKKGKKNTKKSEHKVKKNTSEKDTTDSEIVPKQVVEGHMFSSGFCIRGNSENNCDNF